MARRKARFPTSPPGRTLATRSLARLAAAGLAGALLAAPGIAEARAGCELIAVLRAESDARIKGVGLVVNARGLIDMTLDGKPSTFRDATACDLDSPQDGFGIDCDWRYAAGGEDAAARDLARLAGRLNACLPTPLEAVEPVIYTEAQIKEMGAKYGPSFEEYLRTNKDLGRFKGDYPIDEDGDVSLDVDLSLDRDDRNGTLRISARFGRY
ncbi:MAG: hypothetical protein ACKO1O_11740 [Erythrobacter sp.]